MRETRRKLMNIFAWVLLFHVLGAFVIVAAVVVEWVLTPALERARSWEALDTALTALISIRFFAAPSAIALLASGLYMAGTAWGWGVPWIDASLGAFVLTGVLGGVLTGRRLAVLRGAIARYETDPSQPLPVVADPA